jgi:hypothetical protein
MARNLPFRFFCKNFSQQQIFSRDVLANKAGAHTRSRNDLLEFAEARLLFQADPKFAAVELIQKGWALFLNDFSMKKTSARPKIGPASSSSGLAA